MQRSTFRKKKQVKKGVADWFFAFLFKLFCDQGSPEPWNGLPEIPLLGHNIPQNVRVRLQPMVCWGVAVVENLGNYILCYQYQCLTQSQAAMHFHKRTGRGRLAPTNYEVPDYRKYVFRGCESAWTPKLRAGHLTCWHCEAVFTLRGHLEPWHQETFNQPNLGLTQAVEILTLQEHGMWLGWDLQGYCFVEMLTQVAVLYVVGSLTIRNHTAEDKAPQLAGDGCLVNDFPNHLHVWRRLVIWGKVCKVKKAKNQLKQQECKKTPQSYSL